jgi:transcriptional antiterminator NusG
MNYFALQVKTGGEERFLSLAAPKLETLSSAGAAVGTIFWPRRQLTIRKKGRTKEQIKPIFPGYVFYEAEVLSTEAYWSLRRTDGFYRFLPDNKNITPLERGDRELLLHFLSYGDVVETSEVYFDENSRIRVIKGPMKGLEGSVEKVDRRKKRAKVRLALYKQTFLIDFGFEVMVPMEKGA